jgi:ADP-ribose pyrophosphatase YjhB (NUDIX family)
MIHIAGGVIYNKNKGIVVVNQNHDSWSLPKGHVETGEEPKDAAIREIWEETGISENKLSYIAPLGFYERMKIKKSPFDGDELRTITIYLFTTEEESLHSHDADIPEVKWAPINEVPNVLTHIKDKEFFKRISPLIEKYVTRATSN